MLKGTALGRTMKDNAWFVGFAPQTNPEIVVVALFESGEHGNLAAPIVRDVIKAYFDKKVRQDPTNELRSIAAFQPGVIPPRAANSAPKATVIKVSNSGAEIEE
jgi:hypothetical protein